MLDVGWRDQMRHRFWPSPKRSNWIRGPHSPLLNRYRGLLQRGYRGYSVNLNSCLDLVPTSRLRRSIYQFPHTPSCRVYNDFNLTPNIMTMIKSSIIFGGAWETKDEMKDAHKRSTGRKKLSDYDSVCTNEARWSRMPYCILLCEEGKWTRFWKPVFLKRCEHEQYQSKINNILNVIFQTKQYEKECISIK